MISKTNLKNFFSLGIAEAAGNLLLFLAVLYLGRTLGAEGLGKVSFARAVILYFLLAVNAGLDLFAIRSASRDHDRIRFYIGHVVSLRLLMASVLILLLLLMVSILPKDVTTKRLLLIFGGTILIMAFSMEWSFQAIERMEISALGRFLGELTYFTVLIILVHGTGQILRVPMARIAGRAVQIVFLACLAHRFFGRVRLRWDIGRWRSWLRKAIPMGAGIIMIQIYYNLDVVILGFLRSDSEVGYYTAAYRILLVIALVGGVFQQSIYPSLSKLFHDSSSKMQLLLRDSVKAALVFVVPVILFGFFMAPWIVERLYGSGWDASATVFRILIFNTILIWTNGLVAHGLLASGKEKRYFIGVTIGAALNLCLNLVLIPRFGMIGAAAATIVSELAVFVYYYAVYLMKNAPEFFAGFYRIGLAGAVSGAAVLALRGTFRLGILLPCILILYFIILYLLRVIPRGIPGFRSS